MDQAVEPRVRRLVAEHLGVSDEDLAVDISLVDDLAADSLDLVELALAIEAEFGVSVPETLLEEIRTYGDVVEATLALAAERRRHETLRSTVPPVVRARVVSPNGHPQELERAGVLTPYAAEEIAADALRIGRGARLEITVPAEADDTTVAAVRQQFSWLGQRGIEVAVRRDHHGTTPASHTHAA